MKNNSELIYNILLLEDDQSLGQLLSDRLAKDISKFKVHWADTFDKAVQLINSDVDWHLALLDVGLPQGRTGFEFAEVIKNEVVKKNKKNIPIIFLTAEADAESRLKGYELGAAEYIPKPFLLKELLLRIDKVLGEPNKIKSQAKIIFKSIMTEVRPAELLVINLKDQTRHSLNHTEMKLLEFLILKSPEVIHRDELMNFVWGESKDLSHRTIDNMIVKLRLVLGSDGQLLKTVRGVGYQFIESV